MLGIVLLSPDWLDSAYPTTREFPVLAPRGVIPVLVRACDWSKSEIGRFHILMANGKPLSDASPDEREEALRGLPQAVRSALSNPLRTNGSLSQEAEQIRDLARHFAMSRLGPRPIDAECLIYAFLEDGRRDTGPVKMPQFLWDVIPEAGRLRFVDLRQQRFPMFPTASGPEVPEGPVFDKAAAFSIDTLAGGEIQAHHLLAAALMDAGAEELLKELGADPATVREAFLVFVLKAVPGEPRDGLASFLGAKSEPEPGKPDSFVPGDARTIASIKAKTGPAATS